MDMDWSVAYRVTGITVIIVMNAVALYWMRRARMMRIDQLASKIGELEVSFRDTSQGAVTDIKSKIDELRRRFDEVVPTIDKTYDMVVAAEGDRRAYERGVDSEIRTRCYSTIRDVALSTVEKYYNDHPARLGDQRSVDNREMILKILSDTFVILNGYRIEPKG